MKVINSVLSISVILPFEVNVVFIFKVLIISENSEELWLMVFSSKIVTRTISLIILGGLLGLVIVSDMANWLTSYSLQILFQAKTFSYPPSRCFKLYSIVSFVFLFLRIWTSLCHHLPGIERNMNYVRKPLVANRSRTRSRTRNLDRLLYNLRLMLKRLLITSEDKSGEYKNDHLSVANLTIGGPMTPIKLN